MQGADLRCEPTNGRVTHDYDYLLHPDPTGLPSLPDDETDGGQGKGWDEGSWVEAHAGTVQPLLTGHRNPHLDPGCWLEYIRWRPFALYPTLH